MGVHEDNRKKINKRLYEINTTLDRQEAYSAIVDYILNISEKSYKQAIKDIKDWQVYTEQWDDEDTERQLINYGVKPDTAKEAGTE